MSVGMICTRIVATASPHESVRTAASRMAEFDVGTLVVVDGTGEAKPLGILTDRDVTTRCVGAGLNAESVQVGSIMTQPVHHIEEFASVETALDRMSRFGTRRLVVVSDTGRLAGLISLDDLLLHTVESMEGVRQLLARQGPRVPA